MKFTDHLLTDGEYYHEVYEKDTLYIHHTAGSNRPDWTIDGWERDRTKSGLRLKVATAWVIGGIDRGSSRDATYDGTIYRAFDDKYWAHHLGLKEANNQLLNQKSVAIEVCNYGPLTKTRDGIFLTYVNSQVPADMVIDLGKPFRGFQYYQQYTTKQLISLKENMLDIANRHKKIDLKAGLHQFINQGVSAFEMNAAALRGVPGVYSHSNARSDKFDMYPHPQLIELIKNL
jgi:hypothetical protein